MTLTTPWTDERIATLTRLWAEGLSARQCADKMGYFTRNSVIGKVHRLGLANRITTVRCNSGPKARAALARKVEAKMYPARVAKLAVFQPEPMPYVAPEELPAKLYTLQEFPETGCKWLYTSPEGKLRYGCQCTRVPGVSYCQGHTNKVYSTLYTSERQYNPWPAQIARARTYELGEV